MVGHQTESFYRLYANVVESMLMESAAKLAAPHESEQALRKEVTKLNRKGQPREVNMTTADIVAAVSAVAAVFSAFVAWLAQRSAKRSGEKYEEFQRELQNKNEAFREQLQEKQLDFQKEMQDDYIKFQKTIRREEKSRQSEQEYRERIEKVVLAYYEQARGKNAGIPGLLAAGITQLKSHDEVMEARKQIKSRADHDPAGGYAEQLEVVDSLEALRLWVDEQHKPAVDFERFLKDRPRLDSSEDT